MINQAQNRFKLFYSFAFITMQESFTKKIGAEATQKLIKGIINIKTYLDDVFGLEKDAFIVDETLARDIQQYYLGEGSPEIHEIKFSDPVYKPETKSGTIRLDFKIKRFYTCSAIENEGRDYQMWSFGIAPDNETITFTGPAEDERGPDDM